MVGMNETSVVGTYQNYNTQKADSRNTYGKTIGEPQLSKKAQKYYEKLKKKYGNYDFDKKSLNCNINAVDSDTQPGYFTKLRRIPKIQPVCIIDFLR